MKCSNEVVRYRIIQQFLFRCYTNFPNGIPHFYQQCMPEGWTQEREISFEGDGIIKTIHEISYEKGTVINNVKLVGTGFNEDSPVLNDGIGVFLPSTEMSYPVEDGIRSTTLHVSFCGIQRQLGF